MRIIEKMKESLQSRRKEKELKQEERLVLREIAQGPASQKNYERKPKSFDEMLDIKIPCKSIFALKNENGETHYFQMGSKDIEGITLSLGLGHKINMPSRFRQLTGDNSGDIHDINPPSGYSDGLYICKFNGFKIIAFDKKLSASREYQGLEGLREQYGETITLRQLLLRWKTDNKQFMNINSETDYETVKRVYDSEDMFSKSKIEELSK